MVTISCPNCHKVYEVNNDVLGMNVECEACHTIFQAVDSSFSPSVRTGAMASKHHIDRKWIVVFSAIGMMMIIQTVTLIIMLSRHGAAENTPVPITGANPAQTETPSELLLKYTEQGETSYVEALLKQNPTLDVDRPRSKTGSTALYTACRLGYVDIAKVLLRRKANVNDDGQQGGFTPITAAAFSGHLSTVKLLLASGVDIESQDRRERTALYAAVEGNKPDVVRFLCESGANVNVKEKSGWAPLTRAAYNGYVDVAKALVKHGKEVDVEMQWNGDTALFLAVCENRPEMIRFLCECGANVNIYGHFSNAWTPLTYAADNGLTEVVSILVRYGKDIDLGLKTRNYPISTPLELASKKHYDDIVKILREKGDGSLQKQSVVVSRREQETRMQEQERAEMAARLLAQRLINEGANGQQTSSPQPNSNWQRITDELVEPERRRREVYEDEKIRQRARLGIGL